MDKIEIYRLKSLAEKEGVSERYIQNKAAKQKEGSFIWREYRIFKVVAGHWLACSADIDVQIF